MVVKRIWLSAISLLLVAGVLSACMQTNYRSMDANAEIATPFSRDIFYQVADAFHADPPECVFVLSATNANMPLELTALIEQALALRLGQKISRVIGPRERRAAERILALDTRNEVDRRYLARAEQCPTYLEWRLKDFDDSHFFVWSRKQIGLEVRLARSADDAILWRAAHTTSRSDGGLPLSLMSLPLAAAEATIFNQDTDQLPSMIGDVVRRLVVTLPDVR